MGLFDYKNADGKALYSDAIALTLYAYTPTGQALPGTGWKPIGATALGFTHGSTVHGVRESLGAREQPRTRRAHIAAQSAVKQHDVDALGALVEKTGDATVTPDVLAANGVVRTARVRLTDVTLGPYHDDSLGAWVNEGEMDGSLLGMDYLGRFSVTMAGDEMVLTR